MAQKLQCSSRRVGVLTGRWDKKPKEDTKRLEMDLKAKRNVLKVLKHRLKEKESTAYLERSRHEIEILKVQIKSIQEEINVISQKRWGRKPKLSDKEKEKFK